MKPKTIIFENLYESAKHASEILEKEISEKPNLVLGLPTGRTVIPLYKELTKLHKKKKIDFSKVKVFILDEYLGLKPTHKSSFRYFMDKNLLKKINIKEKNINLLSGSALNFRKECKKYEQKIKKAKGLDITILGIGVNCHIAFNEPGSPFKSRTRKVILTHETRRSNFGILSVLRAPKRALTIGIGTILESKKIILIATGKHKANAIKAMLKGPITTKCPASALKKHKDVTVLLDKRAASEL
ncbi:MAG: glucosamine-6-phosphate deaminase [Nanoarchaeota archaeon]